MIRAASQVPVSPHPRLGLVCITIGPAVRYRTVTRTRYLALSEPQRREHIRQLYDDNLNRLFGALAFCHANDIRLYRVTSALFPQIDDPSALEVLREFRGKMAAFGGRAQRLGIRVVLHPDQYVVLNSESEAVVRQSIGIMERHAMVFDRLGLPRSSWSAMILHGGKGGRGEQLIQTIGQLPEGIRSRLVLENDESTYGAGDILEICRRARVPMVFDIHHHAVKERLSSYEEPGIAEIIRAAATTWPEASWQIVHLSNGERSFNDPRHSELIQTFPAVLQTVPWIEIEAKGKENAIQQLRDRWLRSAKLDTAMLPPERSGSEIR